MHNTYLYARSILVSATHNLQLCKRIQWRDQHKKVPTHNMEIPRGATVYETLKKLILN